jgi:NADH-quinone oxidoreductase subunit K
LIYTIINTFEILLIFSLTIFILSLIGFLTKKKIILNYIFLEMMLSIISLVFAFFSGFYNNVDGVIFILFILSISSAEISFGLIMLYLLDD